MSKLNKKTIDTITKVTTEREVVLNSIKEKVNSGNDKVLESLDAILEKFEETDKKNKEYVAILKVKEMIESLIDEILKADTLEEVEAIRKKLNYQINKVKSVLVKKGETPADIEAFTEKAKETKNWITEYLRTMKRKANLDIISLANQDEIPEEEKNNILKMVRSESRFNKRINDKLQGIAPKPRVKKEKPVEIPTDEIPTTLETSPEEGASVDLVPVLSNFESTERPRRGYVHLDDFSDTKEYWRSRYQLEEMAPYDGNIFSRIGSFFKNIPAIVVNRRILRTMVYDHNVYCGAPAFGAAIDDVYQETRIRNGLKGLFFGGKLAKREVELEDASYDNIIEFVETVEDEEEIVETQQFNKTYSI